MYRYIATYYHPDTTYEWVRWRDELGAASDACPFAVPSSLVLQDGQSRKQPDIRPTLAERYPELYQALESGHVEDAVLDRFHAQRFGNRPLIGQYQEDGSWRLFRARIRGDNQYAARSASVMSEVYDALADGARQWMLLTLTVDPKRLPQSLIAGWQACAEARRAVMRYISERLHMSYLWVRESHASGYPHIHVLIAAYDTPIPTYERDGILRANSRGWKDGFEARWGLGYVDLQVLKPGPVCGYLLKYIGKGLDAKSVRISDATDEEERSCKRKASLGLAIAIMSGVRLYGYGGSHCKLLIQERRLRRQLRQRNREVQLLEALKVFVSAHRLDNILNNFPCRCGQLFGVIFKKAEIKRFDCDSSYILDSHDDLIDEFVASAHWPGCPGCVFTGRIRDAVTYGQPMPVSQESILGPALAQIAAKVYLSA